jgi:hypothetical protein
MDREDERKKERKKEMKSRYVCSSVNRLELSHLELPKLPTYLTYVHVHACFQFIHFTRLRFNALHPTHQGPYNTYLIRTNRLYPHPSIQQHVPFLTFAICWACVESVTGWCRSNDR